MYRYSPRDYRRLGPHAEIDDILRIEAGSALRQYDGVACHCHAAMAPSTRRSPAKCHWPNPWRLIEEARGPANFYAAL
jgi:hypothetical protein